MSPILEGNEIEKEFDGGAGKFVTDVDAKGGVKVSLSYAKKIDDLLTANAAIGVETNIFKLAEAIAAKTATKWDDSAIKALESLLGIQADAPAEAAPAQA